MPAKTKKSSKQESCEHHKESCKSCVCVYCKSVHNNKENNTRDRLRTRLNQRKVVKNNIEEVSKNKNLNSQKHVNQNSGPKNNVLNEKTVHNTNPSGGGGNGNKVQTKNTNVYNTLRLPQICHLFSSKSTNLTAQTSVPKSSDSRDINELLDFIEGTKTVGKVDKKSAKKERQRLRRVQEKERIETEKQLKDQEQLKEVQIAQTTTKLKKKNKKKAKNNNEMIEENIPAMVTIKRAPEGNTITITLEQETPGLEKLLSTLVNGNNKKEQLATLKIYADKAGNTKNDSIIQIESQPSSNNNNNKKNDKKQKNPSNANEPKVIILVKKSKKPPKQQKTNPKAASSQSKKPFGDAKLPMLHLPPDITITKIEVPQTNSNRNASSNMSSTNVTVNLPKNNKKNKKKNKKNQQNPNSVPAAEVSNPIVTLKNPMVHVLQTTAQANNSTQIMNTTTSSENQPAWIVKNDNGTVTIRRTKTDHSHDNAAPVSTYLSAMKPAAAATPATTKVNSGGNNPESPTLALTAEEILSGLSEIQITKVDKDNLNRESKSKKASEPADVSIVPTGRKARSS